MPKKKTTVPKKTTTAAKAAPRARKPKTTPPAPTPRKARQQALPGTRKADAEIDAAAEELDEHRCARLTAGKKEQEAEAKLVALMTGKGLTEYLLADGDRVVVGPKSTKLGAKIIAPKEDDEDDARARRQTTLSVVEDGLGSDAEELPF